MASEGDVTVEVEHDDRGGTLLRVRGELDLATSTELESALQETSPERAVVIDLTECEFLDSSAVRVLLTGGARAESAGGRVSLVVPDQRLRRVLEIANVGAKLPIHATREAAS